MTTETDERRAALVRARVEGGRGWVLFRFFGIGEKPTCLVVRNFWVVARRRSVLGWMDGLGRRWLTWDIIPVREMRIGLDGAGLFIPRVGFTFSECFNSRCS